MVHRFCKKLQFPFILIFCSKWSEICVCYTDDDECSSVDRCSDDSLCQNYLGGFDCECKDPGYFKVNIAAKCKRKLSLVIFFFHPLFLPVISFLNQFFLVDSELMGWAHLLKSMCRVKIEFHWLNVKGEYQINLWNVSRNICRDNNPHTAASSL